MSLEGVGTDFAVTTSTDRQNIETLNPGRGYSSIVWNLWFLFSNKKRSIVWKASERWKNSDPLGGSFIDIRNANRCINHRNKISLVGVYVYLLSPSTLIKRLLYSVVRVEASKPIQKQTKIQDCGTAYCFRIRKVKQPFPPKKGKKQFIPALQVDWLKGL